MDFQGVSSILLALAAVMGPTLVFFTSKRANADTARQTAKAAALTETAAQLTSWREIAERHEKDRDRAEKDSDDQRKKRREAEDELDKERAKVRQLHEENLTLRGVVAGEVALTATVFPAIAPSSIHHGPLESSAERRSLSGPGEEGDQVEESRA